MLLKRFAETNDNDGRRVRIVLNCDIELRKETMEYEIKIPHQAYRETIEFSSVGAIWDDALVREAECEPNKRPVGEWITYYPFMLSIEAQRFNGAKNPTKPIPDKRFGRIKCSLCGCPHPIPNDKYCPGCGAKMLNGETKETL